MGLLVFFVSYWVSMFGALIGCPFIRNSVQEKNNIHDKDLLRFWKSDDALILV